MIQLDIRTLCSLVIAILCLKDDPHISPIYEYRRPPSNIDLIRPMSTK